MSSLYGVEMSQSESENAELPLESVGARLMRARTAQGKSLQQVSALTRIPERHLAAIEAGDFAALPARTYAVGFSRSYAKVLGLDDAVVAADVRQELTAVEPDQARRSVPTFEPGDPKLVPSNRLTWLAVFGVLAVIVASLLLWRSLYAPSGSLGSILPAETPAPALTATPAPAATAASGPVVFTALEPDIWVKFYDAAGRQLLQKQLAQGESWTVPADQGEVLIWTGRPEALAITIGGQSVPKLSDVQRTIKDMPVTAAALLARGAPAASPSLGGTVGAASLPAQRPATGPQASPQMRPQPNPAAATPPALSPPATNVPAVSAEALIPASNAT